MVIKLKVYILTSRTVQKKEQRRDKNQKPMKCTKKEKKTLILEEMFDLQMDKIIRNQYLCLYGTLKLAGINGLNIRW